MRTAIALGLLVASLPAVAGVYRWVDDKGVVHYSDHAPSPNAKEAQLPKLQTFDSHSLSQGMPLDSVAPSSSDQPAPVAAVDVRPKITSPADQATLRDVSNTITVDVDAPPQALLVYYLDGQRRNAVPTRSTSYLLENIDRGTHTIEVATVGIDGHEIARSDKITVYMKQPTVNMTKGKKRR
jgi:hypothetical protein